MSFLLEETEDSPQADIDTRLFGFNVSVLTDGRFDKDNSSVESFAISLGINVGIMLILVSLFLVFRAVKIKWLPPILNCRRYFNARTKGVKHYHSQKPYIRVPTYEPYDKHVLGNRRWPRGAFSWIWPIVWGYRVKKICRTHGIDAAMYLVWLRNCFFFAIALAGPSLVILLPINTTGTNEDLPVDSSNYVTGMGRTTISNIDTGDSKLAAHVVMTYIYSILAYILCYCTYWQYTKLRRKYFSKNCARAYTVMLEEIPKKWKSDKGLKQFFESVCPVKVTAAHICWQTKKVREYHDKRIEYIFEYESQANLRNKKTICWNCCPWFSCCPGGKFGDENPTTTTGCCGCGRGIPKLGDKVEALPFYRGKVKKYEAKLRGVQENPRSKLHRTHVGFVSFESAFMARVACHAYINAPVTIKFPDCCLTAMKISPAPEPEDIFWENLNVYQLSFTLRSLIITAIMLLLVIFWFLPTLFLTSVANVQYLSNISGFGWLDGINGLPSALRGFVQGFLPTFTLFILFQILYPILKLVILKLAGFHVKSSAYWLIFLIYWAFLIANVLFVVTIGGSVITLIQEVVDDPASIIDLLASTLPQQSLFFLQYIMVAGLGRQPISLVRVLNLFKWIFGHLKQHWAAIPGDFEYPRAAAQDLLIFTILIVYSVMAPLVTAFGIMYFGLCLLTSKYNMLYANIPQWESGGRIWPIMYHPIMAAIMLFQLTMLGLLAVNVSGGAIALIFPPLFTILFWILLDRQWKVAAQYGPISEVDKTMQWQDEFANQYVDPALRPDLWKPYSFDRNDDKDEEEGEYEPPPLPNGDYDEGDETTSDSDGEKEEPSSGSEGEAKESDSSSEEEGDDNNNNSKSRPSSTSSTEFEGGGDTMEMAILKKSKTDKKKGKKKNKDKNQVLDV